MQTRRVMTLEQAERLAAYVVGLTLPFTITIGDGKSRTVAQNALMHKWYGEVAKHQGDRTMIQVKGECHHRYGLPIKRRCEQFAWVWKQTGERMDYEAQCKYLASGVLNVSSSMSVKELTEYMDAMRHDYAEQGIYLTDPELRGYDEDMIE